MNQRRAVITRRDSATKVALEQQLWPIQAALFVFGAFGLGVVRAATDWHEPHLLRNTAFWFVLLSASVTLAVWGVSKIPPSRFRRVSVLASVLSLIFNLALFVAVAWIRIFTEMPSRQLQEASQQDSPSPTTTLDFALQVYQDPKPDKPLDAPVATDQAEPVAASQTQADASPEFAAPVPESGQMPALAWDQEKSPRRELAVVPRESPEPSPLKRSLAATSRTAQTADLPAKQVADSSTAPQGKARNAATRAQAAPSDAMPTRLDSSRNSESPLTDITMSSLTNERRADDMALPPRMTQTQDQPGLSPLSPLARRQAAAPLRPTVLPLDATNPTTAPTRDEVADHVAEASDVALRQSAELADQSNSEAPQRTQLSTGPTDTKLALPRRVEQSDLAAAEAFDQPAALPRQVLRVAEAPQSPREVPTRSLAAQSTDSGEPLLESARMVLSASTAGTAGVGESRNFADLPRSTLGEAPTESDFARRREPSQQMDKDTSMSPSELADLPRVPSKKPQVGSSRAVAAATQTNTSPSESLSASDAIPSSNMDRTASQADPVEGTGDVGAAQLDIGPPRFVGEGIQRRPGGGGEPQVSNAPIPLPRATMRTGSTPHVAIATPTVVELAASPQARGGGLPVREAAESGLQPDSTAQGPDFSTSAAASSMLAQQFTGSATSASPQLDAPRRGGAQGADAPTNLASVPQLLKRQARSSGPLRAPRKAELPSVRGADQSSGEVQAMTTGSPGSRPLETMLGRADAVDPSPGDAEIGTQPQGSETTDTDALASTKDQEDHPGSMRWDMVADVGLAGLGGELPGKPGLDDPRGTPDAEAIAIQPRRFQRLSARALPATSSVVAVSADAFKQRLLRKNAGSAPEDPSGPTTKTEAAIELGLAYLARVQLPDGRWSLQSGDSNKDRKATKDPLPMLQSDTAATGLALLSYLGAGYHHRDDPYRETVRKGLNFLIANQRENGDLFVPQDSNSNRSVALYSHGIAALALSEAYGMTQDSTLKESAQRGLDFIIDSQCEPLGGWRYAPGVQSDTSVSGWMMMALKSGELAGLRVSAETYAGIERWLEQAQASEDRPYLYRYNPYAPDTAQQRHGKFASPTITSVGLLMRLYGGWRREHPSMRSGADYLLEYLPTDDSYGDTRRNTYYWYYATQVMFHMGGEHWRKWNERLHPLLINSQIVDGENAGSWNPRNPVPDRWGAQAGRLYVTAMNLLSLEIYYRHLPLYDGTLADVPRSR